MILLTPEEREIKHLFQDKHRRIDAEFDGYVEGYNRALWFLVRFIEENKDLFTPELKKELFSKAHDYHNEFQISRHRIEREGY